MKIKELTILFLIILAVLKVRASITQEQKYALINFYKQNRANYNDDKININELYWDDQRAKYAEYNTNICPNKNQTSIINNYNETELFNQIVSQKDSNGEPNYKAKFIGSMTGGKNIDNSTQIITKMGCVLVNCNFDNVDFRFMECNYKTGNITGQETYALVPKTPVFGLTQEQKDTLLNLHRQARAAVNASNMKELNWDDELANIAQDHASTCEHGHSNTGPENIAGGTWKTVTDLFNLIMEEKDAFDESNYRTYFLDTSYNGETVGHYSQVVWASNTKLGCGLTYCSGYEALLVCRYEDGNTLGSEVYSLKNTTIAISTTSTIEPIITTITNTTSTIKPSATTNTTTTTTSTTTTTITTTTTSTTTTTITTTTTSTTTTTTTTNAIKPKITTSITTTSTIKPKTVTTTTATTIKPPTTTAVIITSITEPTTNVKKTTTKKTTTKKNNY